MQESNPFTRSSLFQHAVRRILRPLVRALIAQGVTAPTFYKIVKEAYVEVASEELGSNANDSRISVTTGVHRRDVKSIREAGETEDRAFSAKVSTLATVVGRWMSDPALTDDTGLPRPLPRGGKDTPGFDALVEEVSRDIRPRAVLDELVRQGIVSVENDSLRLQPEAVVGPANLDQKLHYFSYNLGDHMNAAVENLLTEPSPYFERALFYNNLSDAAAHTIEKDARSAATEMLKDLNIKASSLQRADQGQSIATHRFRFGVYFYREDEGPQEKDDHEGTRAAK